MAQSCKDQGKQLSTQYYARPNISAQEVRNPNSVITENIGPYGEITSPRVYSPAAQFKKTQTILSVLMELVTAERVARRQYDELIMFPELSKFVPDILYIRNDEKEHELILDCIIQRLTNPTGQVTVANPLPQTSPKEISGVFLTKKQIGEAYETILDRFAAEEEKSVKNYEEFLVEVHQTGDALVKSSLTGDTYSEIATPLNELEQKIRKHLSEEKVHLDVVNALADMFENMKVGNLY